MGHPRHPQRRRRWRQASPLAGAPNPPWCRSALSPSRRLTPAVLSATAVVKDASPEERDEEGEGEEEEDGSWGQVSAPLLLGATTARAEPNQTMLQIVVGVVKPVAAARKEKHGGSRRKTRR